MQTIIRVYVMISLAVVAWGVGVLNGITWPLSIKTNESLVAVTCISAGAADRTVGGLSISIPRLAGAYRLDYTGADTSLYSVRAAGRDVITYYLSALAADCWNVAVVGKNEAVWTRGQQAVTVTVGERALGSKSVVAYQAGPVGRVLGTAVHIAQATEPPPSGSTPPPPGDSSTPPPSGSQGYMPQGSSYPETNTPGQYQAPSCDGGSISCPGMNGGSYCFYGSTCPSSTTPTYPGGNYPGQMPPAPSCSSGQYTCNNVCIPNGSSCNNYPYYQPGNMNPSCGGASYFCQSKNQCVPQGESCPPSQQPYQQPSQPYPAPGMPNQPTQPYQQNQPQANNQLQNPGMQPPMAGKFGPESMGKPEFGREQGEDMQPKMDEQRFQQMKNGMRQFGNGIKQMQKMVTKLEKQLGGTVAIPPELKAALAKAPEVLALIKNAKSAEELEEAMDDVQDIGETMQDWGPRLGDLMRLRQMLKQGDRELKNLRSSVSRAQTYAKRNAAVADAAAELKSMYDAAAAALAEAKALAKTDAEGALDKIENGFYGNMEEFWSKVAFVDMAQNLTRGITKANSELRRAEQAIAKLQKKLGDEKTAEFKTMVAELKAKMVEVKNLGSQRPVDIEAFQAAGEELWDQFVELQNRLAELGVSLYIPTIQSQTGVKFELPQGYGSMPGIESGDGGMPQAFVQPQAPTMVPGPGF